MKYRPEIDGLRAVAVAPVVLHHAGFPAFSGGYVGVDIFFVISGFLISQLILDDIKSGQFSFASFYERRARRILPALMCMVLVCFLFAWAYLNPHELKDFGESVISVVLFYSNLHFLSETDYFATDAALKPLLHTWSLSVEEQFYLVYPVLLLALLRKSMAFAWKVLFVISLISLLSAEIAWRYAPDANYFLYPTRAWELGIGCLVALNFAELQRVGDKHAKTISYLGILMIALSIVVFDDSTPFPSLYALLPVFGTAFVILFATEKTALGGLLANRWLVGLGLISYSFYLWHQPVFAFAKLRFGFEPGTAAFAGLIAIALVLAIVSWRYVERPFRDRSKFSRTSVFKFSLFAGASLICCAVALVASVKFGFLNSALSADLANRLRPNFGISQRCDYRGPFKDLEECKTAKNATLALWGDSYAMQLFGGLAEALPGTNIVQITRSSCASIVGVAVKSPSITGARSAECNSFNAQAIQYLISNKAITDVVLASRYDVFLTDDALFLDSNGNQVRDNGIVMKQLLATIDSLTSAGKRVTVVSSAPRTGVDLGRCLARSIRFDGDITSCNFGFESYISIEKDLYKERVFLEKIIAENISLIMLEDYICDKSICYASQGNTMIYKDYGHLSIEGSKWPGRNTKVFDAIRNKLN
jgi:peptidoglycan/LPS O-acetylase OafA/YrhL